jgi:hypothetical protein
MGPTMGAGAERRTRGFPGDPLSYLNNQRKLPYPSFCMSSTEMNLIAAEFMQYLRRVGGGPS